MNLSNRKILVTGADGFIGSHLVEALVREGHDVRAFVYYNSLNSWGWLDQAPSDVAGEFEVVEGDIRDPHGVRDAMRGCSVVLHLAALIGIPFSYYSPDTYVDTNVKGTLNILQAARNLNVEKILCTSTSEVYGTARFVPMTEEHPLNPQSPYAATKAAADHLALSFHRAFGLPVAILRPFNTYGPRQSARAVIPTVIGQLASGERVLNMGSLHPTRDFTFVGDVTEGFIQAAACDRTIGRVTNIGSGFEISIGETVELIADGMGIQVEVKTDSRRLRPAASEVDRLYAGTEAAQNLFGWQPTYAGREGFREGLRLTADWFSQPANLGAYKPMVYNV